MRQVETCPFRNLLPRGDSLSPKEEKAICQHLVETSGVRDHSLAIVGRDVCEHCCTYFEPREDTPNPAVASRLVHLAVDIIAQNGVDGCTIEAAQALKKLAISHLQVVGAEAENRTAQRVPRDGGFCFYLGDETGTRPCRNCHGRVVLKTFACTHELHVQDTVIRECDRCPDFDQALRQGQAVKTWAVGVTTAPRAASTLNGSLQSLARAGWPHPHVFAEPDTDLPEHLAESQALVRRPTTLGAWPNFYLSLVELLMRFPHADAYLMCQDDVLYAVGLRAYLETQLWPTRRLGVISLHTASHQDRGDVDGFYPVDHGWDAWGAQAYVFPNAAARAFVRHARVLNHRNRGPRDGLCNVDSVVGRWCHETGFAYYLHTPSLTQHVGDTSTLWTTARTQGRRRAATFQEEAPRDEADKG